MSVTHCFHLGHEDSRVPPDVPKGQPQGTLFSVFIVVCSIPLSNSPSYNHLLKVFYGPSSVLKPRDAKVNTHIAPNTSMAVSIKHVTAEWDRSDEHHVPVRRHSLE